ncbi:MAG: alpha-galactosidase [Deltaproteobacteria bacterium]|nr:alpha-galactosidase [Deltaproteobacteria bacterium]
MRLDEPNGRISIVLPRSPDGTPIEARALVPRLHVDGRWLGPDGYPEHLTTRGTSADGAPEWTLTFAGAAGAPDLVTTLRATDDRRGVVTRLVARNRTGTTVTIEGFELGARPGDGGWVRIGGDPATSTMWIQGQSSWSFAGTVTVNPGQTGADAAGRIVPDDELFQLNNNTATEAQTLETLLRGRDGIPLSWWNVAIEAPARGGALLAGALTAERFKTSVLAGFDPALGAGLPAEATGAFTALRLVSGVTGDHVPLAPGSALESEELVLASYPSGLEALAAHAALASERMEVLPRSDTTPKIRLGWSSWSDFYAAIDEPSLLGEARFMAEHLALLGYQAVQLDDGYQTAWGDWRMNEKFPSGYEGVAKQIRDLGLVPGIWIAPFLVDDALPIVAQHPDWFVTRDDGSPVIYGSALFGFSRRVIDVTHPAAAEFVRSNLARIRDAGFGLVKADFLFGASYEGRHFDASATGLDAYRRGLRLIRETLGPDVTIIGIAGPWLASAGALDYYRQSNDVELQFPGPSWPFYEAEALGTSARSHTHERFFRSDPDHVIVEPALNFDEARAVASYVALSGGLWFAGDALTRLPHERLALLTHPDLLAIVQEGRAATPLDLLDAAASKAYTAPIQLYLARLVGVDALSQIETPSLWKLDRPGGTIVLGIFNWEDVRRARAWSRTELTLDDRAYAVREVFGGVESTLPAAGLSLDQPPHSVTLLELSSR